MEIPMPDTPDTSEPKSFMQRLVEALGDMEPAAVTITVKDGDIVTRRKRIEFEEQPAPGHDPENPPE
jgi:hypothetical protein